MDVVHADDASHGVLEASFIERIRDKLGPGEVFLGHVSIVVIGFGVDSEAPWSKPTRAVRLLAFDDKQLHRHDRDHERGHLLVRLPVEDIFTVYFEVERHRALDGKHGQAKLDRKSEGAPSEEGVDDLGDQEERVEDQDDPICLH